MPVYSSLNDGLTGFGLGVFKRNYDRIHAFGKTTTNVLVWLPIVDNSEEHWNNKAVNDFIYEVAKLDTTKKAWKSGKLREKRLVISRVWDSIHNAYNFTKLGDYSAVCFYAPLYLRIYARIDSDYSKGDIKFGEGPKSWLTGYASDENDVNEKINQIRELYEM
jgi:hypothetical protein